MEEMVKKFEMVGIVPEKTESGGTLVFVPEKDGTFRFYMDYCNLNEVAIRESYPNR